MERQRKCQVCDKVFDNENNILIHFQSNGHLQREKCQRSVFISHVPTEISIDNIVKYITQFAKITKYDVSNKETYNNVTIEFKDKESVQVVLSKTIVINNKKLHVYPMQYFVKNEEQSNPLRYDKIKAVFNTELNFNDQLREFIKTIAITDEEIKLRYEPVCQELHKLLQTVFPKSKCHIFGSITTGLGLKDSDIDIYINMGKPVIEDNTYISGPHVITMDNVFLIIEKILRKNKDLFSKCCLIRLATMPIIKFFYLPTKVPCDISFKNNIAVYNSKLVHYYLSINFRFKATMMIIKYWLYNYEIANTIGITKYAMTILFIFYLQQLKLVPSVIKLQEECKVPLFIRGWQVNFNSESTRSNMQKNCAAKSIPEILEGFFEFYANYDFKTQVLCPIDGQSHSKKSFEEKKYSPHMTRYINYLKKTKNPEELPTWKTLCLQDPIELNNNLTKNLNNAYIEKLQNYFSLAAKIVLDSSRNNYANLLKSLFNFKDVLEMHKIKYESIPLKIYPSELLQKTISSKIMATIYDATWFDITLNLVRQILENVLKLHVRVRKSMQNSLKGEMKDQTVSSNNEKVIILNCQGNQRLWFNRKGIKLYCNVQNPLEKESMITDQLMKSIAKNKNTSNIIVNVECYVARKTIPTDHMTITLYDNGCSNAIFNEFQSFFQAKTPSILKKVFTSIDSNERWFENLMKFKFE